MDKLFAMLDLFRKGSAVANPTAWKNHQVTATMVGVVIMAIVQLAKALGYALPIDDDTATAIAGGVIGVVNIVLTYVSSDKVGLLPAKQADEQPIVLAVEPKADMPLLSEALIREAKEAAIRDRVNTGA